MTSKTHLFLSREHFLLGYLVHFCSLVTRPRRTAQLTSPDLIQDSDTISASEPRPAELPPVISQGATDPGGGGRRGHPWSRSPTPEEFARDYQVPLEAVLEALDYVAQRPLIELRGTARRPSFAPGASTGPRRDEAPTRREHERPTPGAWLRARGTIPSWPLRRAAVCHRRQVYRRDHPYPTRLHPILRTSPTYMTLSWLPAVIIRACSCSRS